jgi:hypothetical protein
LPAKLQAAVSPSVGKGPGSALVSTERGCRISSGATNSALSKYTNSAAHRHGSNHSCSGSCPDRMFASVSRHGFLCNAQGIRRWLRKDIELHIQLTAPIHAPVGAGLPACLPWSCANMWTASRNSTRLTASRVCLRCDSSPPAGH